MSESIRNLEPKAVWNNFVNLNGVPRPSKKEEKVQKAVDDGNKQIEEILKKKEAKINE